MPTSEPEKQSQSKPIVPLVAHAGVELLDDARYNRRPKSAERPFGSATIAKSIKQEGYENSCLRI
jgi:hypothetical protein